MDVVVWLRSLGLEEYEAAFRDNAIAEKLLPSLKLVGTLPTACRLRPARNDRVCRFVILQSVVPTNYETITSWDIQDDGVWR
jgi:hypothetical protein